MKKSISGIGKMLFGLTAVLFIVLWSVVICHAQFPFYNSFYNPRISLFASSPFLPYSYWPPALSIYHSYFPYTPFSMVHTLSMFPSLPMLNALSRPLLSMGLPSAFISPMRPDRIARQVTTALPLTSIGTSVVTPVVPTTTAAAPAATDITLSVLLASALINTGNPQVSAVLALIANDPTLLDNPLLLNALINTGNSQVSAVLALLAGGII
ncbi:MAG: hypothetical protein ACMUIA_02635 [bacterium]